GHDQADGRSRAHPPPSRGGWRFPPARRTTGNGPTQIKRWHPTSIAEPPRPNRRRHPRLTSSVLGRQPSSDPLPEPNPILPPRSRRPTRRPLLAAHRPNRLHPLLLANHPTTPPSSRCCDHQLNPPCTPRSEWWISPSRTAPWRFRSQIACSNAFSARSVFREREGPVPPGGVAV